VHMSPTLNRSSVLQRFEYGNAIEVCNRIMFDLYPHVYLAGRQGPEGGGCPHGADQPKYHHSTDLKVVG